MNAKKELIKICQELGYDINNLTKSNWWDISKYQGLSEEFIKQYKEFLDGGNISLHQTLSEGFIAKNKEWLNSAYISYQQVLSERFIERNKDWLYNSYISSNQVLSEYFIERHKDWLVPLHITIYQKLSEDFIERNKSWLPIQEVVKYQKVSNSFIEENKLIINKENSTLYWNNQQKIELLQRNGWTVEQDGYVYAWKGIRKKRKSVYDRRITYNIGEIYTAHCDCNLREENSFGLYAWTYEKAKIYCKELVIEVRFKPEWLGAITPEGSLRLHKIEIIS